MYIKSKDLSLISESCVDHCCFSFLLLNLNFKFAVSKVFIFKFTQRHNSYLVIKKEHNYK